MDATQLTALRTAAASGLATDLLARPDACTAAILGSGVQAGTHLLAVCAVRPIERVRIFSRSPQHVAAFISCLQPKVAAVLLPASSAAEAVREADVVCATTTSTTPVVAGDDLRAGVHVNAVGSFSTEAREVDGATVRRAGMVFVDNRSAALAEAGDVVIPLRQGLIGEDDLVELGSVVVGSHPGRTAPDAVTIFKSVGLAVQDVAAGAEVLRRARELGLGAVVPL
jgi:ornithine cyclodeaminase/alanine dehydrogenase-like protein (mu-crystallin family)